MKYTVILPFILFLFIVSSCNKDENNQPVEPYFPQVKSIIEQNCFSCHSSAGNWNGRPVAFDSDSAIALQYQAIKAAVADPVSPTNKRMPEDGTLSAEQIEIIIRWFDKGGKVTD